MKPARGALSRPPRSRRQEAAAAAGAAPPPLPPPLVIMETSAVVGVLWARHQGREPPQWFGDGVRDGRLAVPRTVEVELKRLRKSNRRGGGGGGGRAGLPWLARLKGRDLQWVYDLYRGPAVDAGVRSRIGAMHEEAVRDPGGAGAAAWLRSKRTFVRERLGQDSPDPRGPAGRRALALLFRAAGNDRDIMAQAVAIAASAAASSAAGTGGGAPPRPAALVSRDGDFTAFAGRLGEISGRRMSVVHYSDM